MRNAGIVIFVIANLCLINLPEALAACPSADITGDCFVDFEDFTVIGAQWLNVYGWNDVNTLANQWLTTDPCVPNDMVYIPDGEFEMGDHFAECSPTELPVHTVTLDSFYMCKYEVTNGQYCQYLNSALGSSIYISAGIVFGSVNNQPYYDTHSYSIYSQIDYNDVSGTFSVRTKGEPPRDMSDDPMVEVSWYGSVAYCNWRSGEEGKEQCYNLLTWMCDFSKNGYRLPTEAEWEYAARGGLSGRRFPWGDTITHSQANYYSYWEEGSPYYLYDVSPTEGIHPDWNDGISPYTSVVGSFSPNGYGLYDMAGNVWEWCNDWYSPTYYSSSPSNNPTGPTSGFPRVIRDGGGPESCRVAARNDCDAFGRYPDCGFRVVLDLN
ncbi:MAG: formylglycine-generating enzyme family protein [Planctomycetota bacterium]|jgi:formylglycine-generating enzyme required for sulfatase activity